VELVAEQEWMMPGSTSKLQLPYPTGTDPVKGGDDAIKALSDALEAGMIPYRMAAGSKVLNASAVTNVSIAVAFAVGRFTFPPKVVVGISNAPGGSTKAIPRAVGISATGFTLYVYSGDGTAMTFSSLQVDWQATQMTVTSANGGDA
jgi:hypothetical protein